MKILKVSIYVDRDMSDRKVKKMVESDLVNVEKSKIPQLLDSLRIQESENIQCRNINKKDFNISLHIYCKVEDEERAYIKLKTRVVLLLNKYRQTIDLLQKNL